MPIQVKIFIGFIQNNEIKASLRENAKWKETKLEGQCPLIETTLDEKDYIGFFIPSPTNYLELKEKESAVKTELQNFCPKLNVDKHSIYLFPQFFLF